MSIATAVTSYNVHIFVDHNPFIASIFLPQLFSNFSDSIWRISLREEIPTSHVDQDWRAPRQALGRYTLCKPVPADTLLRDVARQWMSENDEIEQAHFAHFTNFNPRLDDGTVVPALWHEWPLAQDKSVAEVWEWYHGPEIEHSMNTPSLLLVAVTKAAVLRHYIGVDWIGSALGMDTNEPLHVESRFASYYHVNSQTQTKTEARQVLELWRYATHALSFLTHTTDLPQESPFSSSEKREEEIKLLRRDAIEAKLAIASIVRHWSRLVPGQSLTIEMINQYLQNDKVEEIMQLLWRDSHKIINNWKISGRRKEMLRTIRESYERAARLREFDFYLQNEVAKQARSTRLPEISFPSTQDPLIHETDTQSVWSNNLKKSIYGDTFNVRTGILLWGNIRSVYKGSQTTQLTGDATLVPKQHEGGTVMRRTYTYRSACRIGKWRVTQYFSSWGAGFRDGEPDNHVGWVIHHEDIDPLTLLRQARAINPTGSGKSLQNEHMDKNVLYVNRYDWSQWWYSDICHPEVDPFFEFAGYEFNTSAGMADASQRGILGTPHFVAVDSDHFDQRVAHLLASEQPLLKDKSIQRTFGDSEKEDFGAYVDKEDTEYEFGWLIFSGNRSGAEYGHELVGIIYDASYELLEGLRHAVQGSDGVVDETGSVSDNATI